MQKIIEAKKRGYSFARIGKCLKISPQGVEDKLSQKDKQMIEAYRETWITNLFES